MGIDPHAISPRFRKFVDEAESKDRASRLHPRQPKQDEGPTLVKGISRKSPSLPRSQIRFVVYAVRPCDWDGWHVKPLQDMLLHADFLGSDDWNELYGTVRSEKAFTKEEERTEIEVIYPT